jgi:hypothetical protein
MITGREWLLEPNLIVSALRKIPQHTIVQRRQAFLARLLWSLRDKEKKRRKAWGEEVGSVPTCRLSSSTSSF